MRRLRYSVASSIDGFIAGPNGEYDWIPMDPDIDFGAMFGRYDTLLMGRKTFEASAAYPTESMAMWKGMRVIVCSNTLAAAAGAELWSAMWRRASHISNRKWARIFGCSVVAISFVRYLRRASSTTSKSPWYPCCWAVGFHCARCRPHSHTSP